MEVMLMMNMKMEWRVGFYFFLLFLYLYIFKCISNSGSATVGHPVLAEDQTRKREQRLLKNREAARECRRKKKEYIKCLENRVAVLENQNKTLIDELKSLKELYCQQKSD